MRVRTRSAAALTILMVNTAASFAPTYPIPKLFLLDRDGVINEDVGSPGVMCKSQFQLTPDAGNAIGTLKRYGSQVAVITNQSCVGKGLLTIPELNAIHIEMQHLLLQQDNDASIDKIYFCPSVHDDPRKKPNPGMILEAAQDFHVDPSQDCVFIGDSLTDMQAAQAAGVRKRILVQTGYGFDLMGNHPALNPPELMEDNSPTMKDKELYSITPFYYAMNLATAIRYLTEGFAISS